MRLTVPPLLALLLALVSTDPAAAQSRRPQPAAPAPVPGEIPAQDAAGARDAAALPRYAGAILLEARSTAFDEMVFPNARLERLPERDGRNNASYMSPDPLRMEGRHTRLVYVLPAGRSVLEVIRGYQQAVRDGGGSIAWECAETACGGSVSTALAAGGSEAGLLQRLYPQVEMPSRPGNPVFCALNIVRSGQRYTLMQLGNNAGTAGVMAFTVADASYTAGDCKPWIGRVVALVNVVETARREQRMETVGAQALGQGLARDGRVALYAVLFDTGRAEVKPESQPQLAEIVTFLRANPATKVLVVGHTDNQGTLDLNTDLSRRRAQAVAAALTAQGIPAARLSAQGVGMAAPLATNDTEEGRSRNRRVELVQQ
jgi:outer membrane protein OmpA-like peptidoglycan-associated protein